MNRTIRVMCVDDDLRMCAALQRFVGTQPGLEWRGHQMGVDGLIERLDRERVDVLLLDLSIPGMRVDELMTTLQRSVPRVRTIVFSGQIRGEMAERALAAGAAAFLSKGVEPTTVIDTIVRVAEQSDDEAAGRG